MSSRPTMLTKPAAAALLIAASAHTQALASPQINELFRAGDTVLSTQGNPYDSFGVGMPAIRSGLITFPVALATSPSPSDFVGIALLSNRTGEFLAEWSDINEGIDRLQYELRHAPTISADQGIALNVRTPDGRRFIQISEGLTQQYTISTAQLIDAVDQALPLTWQVTNNPLVSPPRFDGSDLTLAAGVVITDTGDTARQAALLKFDAALMPTGALLTAGVIPPGLNDAIVEIAFTQIPPLWDNGVAPYHAIENGRTLTQINTAPTTQPRTRTSHLVLVENGISTVLFSEGDPIPGTDRFFASFNASKLAMRGDDYVFTAIDSEGENALYGVLDGEFRTIVDASTPIPGGAFGQPATFGDNNGPSFGGIAMNSDYIVFAASPQRTAGPFVNGIFAYDGTTIRKIVYNNETILPDGSVFTDAAFGPEGLDDDNTIVFKGYDLFNRQGIYSIQLDITPAPCPGDITGNGLVNLDDFAILAANFGAGPGATPQQGDLNDDGFVDLDDFAILAVNFGNECN